MWILTGLYIVYYLLLPLGLLYLIWKIWDKRKVIKGYIGFGRREKNDPLFGKKVGEMERLQVLIIIFLLLFVPVSNLVSYQIQEMSIKYDRMPAGGFGQSIVYNQVKRQLGPSYDAESIISEMETYLFSLEKSDYELKEGNVTEKLRDEFEERGYDLEKDWNLTQEEGRWWIVSDEEKKFRIEESEDELEVYEKPSIYERWFLEDIREEIDLEQFTRFPGRLAVYYLDKDDVGELIVITYSYLSPLPITKSFTFIVGKDEVSLYQENTIIYPSNPSNIDPF